MYVNSRSNEEKAAEYALFKTLSSVEDSGLELEYAYKIENATGNYLVVGYPSISLSLHSGPPAGVFDETENLVDFSSNPGDEPVFQDKWRGSKGKSIRFTNFIVNNRKRQ
jgi:hypothetical protein